MSDAADHCVAGTAVHAAPRAQLRDGQNLMHGGINVGRFVGMTALGAIFPITAGLLLFGWRALGAMLTVLGSSLAAAWVWRRIGARGAHVHYDHVLWLALLLALTLPAHLFAGRPHAGAAALWPVLPAAGATLVMLIWLLGGIGSGRVQPLLIAHLLLFVCFSDLLVPRYALQRGCLFWGDLLRAYELPAHQPITTPWLYATQHSGADALRMEPASQRLIVYTSGTQRSPRTWVSLDAILRDRMPPLEDLIVGGHSAPIGSGSAIAVIIGGLFLIYHGLIDYRVPMLTVAAALAALLVLPVPVVIRENDVVWRWAALRLPDVGWELALTLANYETMSSPLLFTAFFLASMPAIRPMTRRAVAVYALLIGLLTGAMLLYVSVSIGPYLALLAVSLLTPTLDRLLRPRTLL